MGAYQPLKHDVSVTDMKAEYDLSQLKSRKNPYASKLKKPISDSNALAAQITAEHRTGTEETSLLLSVPGMRDSIRAGMVEPLAKSSRKLKW